MICFAHQDNHFSGGMEPSPRLSFQLMVAIFPSYLPLTAQTHTQLLVDKTRDTSIQLKNFS